MATKTAKKEQIFTRAQLAEKKRKLYEELYEIKPVDVDAKGYLYDGIESMKAIQKKKEKE